MEKVDHIAVLVENLEVSKKWYEEMLGAKVIFTDHKHIRMKLQNVTLAIIDKKHYKHPHFAVTVHSFDDLPSNIGDIIHHRDGTTGCYVKDPDDNMVEFIYYSDECKEKMKI